MTEKNYFFLQKEATGFQRGRYVSLGTVCKFLSSFLFAICLYSGFVSICAAEQKASPPQRIISLSPGVTEILFAIGAGDRVVGVTDFCNYPEKAKSLPKVGGLLNPSYETMITLKPDLIIHQPNKHKIKNFVDKLGIQHLPITMLSFAEIYDSIQKIGIAVQREEAANGLIHSMQKKIEFHRRRLAGVSQKSVLLLLGISNDSMRELYGVGPKTFLGEMLALAGGNNILAETQSQYPKVSKEFIIHESPEIIIEIGRTDILTEESSIKRRQGWQKFSTIRAVKNQNIHIIGSDYILIPGPRLVNIVELFVNAIHPELASGKAPVAENTGHAQQ